MFHVARLNITCTTAIFRANCTFADCTHACDQGMNLARSVALPWEAIHGKHKHDVDSETQTCSRPGSETRRSTARRKTCSWTSRDASRRWPSRGASRRRSPRRSSRGRPPDRETRGRSSRSSSRRWPASAAAHDRSSGSGRRRTPARSAGSRTHVLKSRRDCSRAAPPGRPSHRFL
jgi:hypothetical protein